MARADALAAERGVAGLMEAAGRAVAREVARRFRPARCVVLCGPGSNGGDGYAAARHLERAGWGVSVLPLAPPSGEAAAMAARWRGPVVREVGEAGVVLDALFGAGLSRDLDGAARALLEAIPERAAVVAVDVPSGLCGATGQVRGFARGAGLTVTFAALKPGHLLLPGRGLCGEVVCADIGLPRAILEEARAEGTVGATFANTPALWSPLPAPGAETHKHRRGHLTLLGGAAMTGAAILAARAARRVGAGLVTIGCDDPAAALVYRSAEPGTLVAEAADETALLDALLADPRRRVWLAGPGLAPDSATRLAVERLLAAPGRALVADAGALSALGGEAKALHGAALLTPHAREFARLFGEPQGDKLAAVRAAARLVGGTVLLKGADTVIAAADGRAAIDANAPPDLATGGTGDVLAGAAAGLIAQGMESFEAACAAAWLLGEAARLAGPGLVAEDLPALLPAAARRASFRGVSR